VGGEERRPHVTDSVFRANQLTILQRAKNKVKKLGNSEKKPNQPGGTHRGKGGGGEIKKSEIAGSRGKEHGTATRGREKQTRRKKRKMRSFIC